VAVGSFNDYCDRDLDAASGRNKPIVRGLLTPREACGLGVAASVVLLATSVSLGPLALLLCVLIEGLGLAYDLGFKGTPMSAVLCAVYFSALPAACLGRVRAVAALPAMAAALRRGAGHSYERRQHAP
jgi:4-hydroxybenzoate polyprenyltransferase